MSKIIRKMQGMWIWTFFFMFYQFKLGEQWHLSIWLYFEFKFGVNLQMTLNSTSFNWNCQHIVTMNITLQSWSCVWALHLYLSLVCHVCLIEVEPELEATPFLEDTVCEPRQQGKQTPFDHVDKNPFPSQSRLCID